MHIDDFNSHHPTRYDVVATSFKDEPQGVIYIWSVMQNSRALSTRLNGFKTIHLTCVGCQAQEVTLFLRSPMSLESSLTASIAQIIHIGMRLPVITGEQ